MSLICFMGFFCFYCMVLNDVEIDEINDVG